jgi:hypothetical protein
VCVGRAGGGRSGEGRCPRASEERCSSSDVGNCGYLHGGSTGVWCGGTTTPECTGQPGVCCCGDCEGVCRWSVCVWRVGVRGVAVIRKEVVVWLGNGGSPAAVDSMPPSMTA